MPNEMPFQIGWQRVDFRQGVLNAVFSKTLLTGSNSLADDLWRIGLRNSHKFDFLGRTPTSLCGGSDALPDKFEIFGDLAHFGNSYMPHLSPAMTFV